MKNLILTLAILALSFSNIFATGEPATQFNIFLPPNNDNTKRDVCLIVTAIYDSTTFNIQDDGMDGDTDDSKTGVLMAGQSYILYIRDNGVNDDSRTAAGGIQKQDGDYFNITADKLILASQSTDSDWQHDWVPSISGKGIGTKFVIYAPKISFSQRDVNVMAYSDSTIVTIRKISKTPTLISGYTNVDMYNSTIVAQKMINRGQDLIYLNKEGRDLLQSGHSYMVETDKPVTVQYGALWSNERDGGGYVPSSNGSASGELFYFTVPYQVTTEQEIRIVSWSENNNIVLDRYLNGAWVNVKNFNGLNSQKAGEWIGKTNGQTYPTVFRVSCTAGKKVSVFEANWLETGSIGTSDIATMASASNGRASGKEFLVYMAPPGYEQNVTNPFTGTKFSQNTHAYIFANVSEVTTVTVKDAFTNGSKLNRTYTIQAGRYVDCNLTVAEWRSIYNGTGTTSGPERPYLLINSSEEVSVMITNFNDNWMMYFGSSQVKGFDQTGSSLKGTVIPGNDMTAISNISVNNTINNANIQVMVGSGLTPISSTLTNLNTNQSTVGTIQTGQNFSTITFPTISTITPSDQYQVSTTLEGSLLYNNGTFVKDGTVASIESVVSATVNGQVQQSVLSQGVSIQSSNTSNFMYSRVTSGIVVTDLTSSWTSNWVDFDGDGDEDLFVTELEKAKQNIMYINNGNGTFTKSNSGIFTSSTDRAATIASTWADTDNDGDLDFVVANDGKPTNFLYKNNGSGSFSRINNDPTVTKEGYYLNASFADYDNDGFVDLFISDYMPTQFNRLFHNKGDGTFEEITNTPISAEASYSLIGAWGDYDNDGDPDLFVANDKGNNNVLYRNDGKGKFAKMESSIISNDGGHSVSANWVDYDNDRDLDLYVVNSNSDAFLYKNNGNGTFAKITNLIITKFGNYSTHGSNWFDVDNDGDQDLYVVANNKSKLLFINNGNGNFTKTTNEVINMSHGSTYSQSICDFDKDGDIDIFETTLNKEVNYLFTHNPTSQKYLEVKLKGMLSNGSAIGARVYVKANINGQETWQMREINAQTGFGGQNSYTQHFGLANASVVDSLIIQWPSGISQKMANINSNQILSFTEPNGCKITGLAYLDLNGNCTKDNNEELLFNKKVVINPGNISAYSDANGVFSAYLPIGSYTLTGISDNYWNASCGSIPFNVSAGLINTDANIGNFGFTAIGNVSDAYVTVSPTALRRGFRNKIVLQFGNNGNSVSENDTVTLSLPSEVVVLSSDIPWNNKTGNTFQWIYSSLKKSEAKSITLVDSVSVTATLGAFVNLEANISQKASDDNLTNNYDLSVMTIVGSLDPNEITVFPQGEGAEGYIRKEEVLTYTIHFENIGNYEAERVILTSDLPDGLDLSTLQVVGFTHNYSLALYGKRLKATFNEIRLPGKVPGSTENQGFLKFRVALLKDIEQGARIENKAEIVFDFNEALETNKTLNSVKHELNAYSIELMPNPAIDKVTVSLTKNIEKFDVERTISQIKVQNLMGSNTLIFNDINIAKRQIDISSLNQGLYIINLIDSEGMKYNARLLVK